MVHALGTPKRSPESGIFLFRKRFPERLRKTVGKSEIKFSLQTRDPAVARLRNLEEMARLERAWAESDGTLLESSQRFASYLDAKFARTPAAVGEPAPVVADAVAAAPDPAGPSEPIMAPPKTPVPLRPIFATYAKEAELAPSTEKRWTPVVDRLIGHLGHDDAAAISRTNIVAWKDALLAGGMSNITDRDVYVAAVKATLQYAVDQGTLAENPAAGIKVRVREAPLERDKGFDGKEAETILSATLRKPSDKISVDMAAARRWVPWICAYTGGRVNEITPLAWRDFVRRDGIRMIRIRAENNKTRKFREVPLHSHLIDKGCSTTRSPAARGRFSTTRAVAAAARIRTRITRRSASASRNGSARWASRAARRITAGATASPPRWKSDFSTSCWRAIATDGIPTVPNHRRTGRRAKARFRKREGRPSTLTPRHRRSASRDSGQSDQGRRGNSGPHDPSSGNV
jgi:integrase